MSITAEIIDILENRIKKLFEKINSLENKNQELSTKITHSEVIIQEQHQTIEELKKQYETLKIANVLLGSEENKRDTKYKINSIIREIDYCIAQLSD